jgi:hypothetical protein
MDDLLNKLTDLFDQAGKAHHVAYASVDGADAEWPIWYAAYLLDKLRPLLGKTFAQDELADILKQLSEEHSQTASGTPWPEYYAKFFVERYT